MKSISPATDNPIPLGNLRLGSKYVYYYYSIDISGDCTVIRDVALLSTTQSNPGFISLILLNYPVIAVEKQILDYGVNWGLKYEN